MGLAGLGPPSVLIAWARRGLISSFPWQARPKRMVIPVMLRPLVLESSNRTSAVQPRSVALDEPVLASSPRTALCLPIAGNGPV